VMKAVMMVAMDTNSRPNLRKRAEKTGKVLQSFLKDEVEPDEVVTRLKEGGGIEKMYRERAEFGSNTPIPDDLDLLKPDLPDPPGEDEDYAPFQAARDGTFEYDDDDTAESSDVDSGRPVESEEGSDRRSPIDHAMMLANGRQSAPAKQSRPARFNPDTMLAVEMSGAQLLTALGSKRLQIDVVIEEEDGEGWKPAKAVKVRRLD
jgi:hypothetical protein